MNFLKTLKECEPNVSQITRDANVSRQAVYGWKVGIPRPDVFKRLSELDKYKEALSNIDYEEARSSVPLGRRVKG